MPVTDPIADMLTRIRNAVRNKKDNVRIRSSKMVISIAESMQKEGYIGGFEVVQNARCSVQNDLLVQLKYSRTGEPVIRKIERVSKPGCRVYSGKKDLKPVLRGLGVWVLSTPKGVMSDRYAREANVGGEVLCKLE